jgi:RNA polymerase sigma factor (sigma-70 family)
MSGEPPARPYYGNNSDFMDDRELIAAYACDRSEDAFTALVKRHVDLVYSSALRQIGDPELARDVTQAVFLMLSRKASSLPPGTILSGWLYRTARFVSLEAIRREKRRKEREKSMALERDDLDTPEDIWSRIAPNLDELMERLRESDRAAIVLRFFQGKSFEEVAAALGINEEAARKRVHRALEKLRQSFARRGITSSSSILSAALAAYAVQPTPATVAAAIPAVAQSVAAFSSVQGLSQGALQMIALTKMKTAAIGAAFLLLATGTALVRLSYSRAKSERAQLIQMHARLQSEQEKAAVQTREELVKVEAENARLATETEQIHRWRARVSDLERRKRESGPGLGAKSLRNAPLPIQAAAEQLRELQFERFVAAGQKAITEQPLSEEQQGQYAR